MKNRLLVGLLVASFALRVALAFGGGQNFWPDESRYGSAELAAEAIGHGKWAVAMTELFGHADHIFFRAASLPAAALEHWAGGQHPILVSCYFSLFSVGAILLVWAISRRTGGTEEAALWSAFLAATANCLFFYSRHFLPYDIALFVLLCALLLAVGPFSLRRSVAVGCTAGLGILIYNGYWLLGATIVTLHVFLGDGGGRRLLSRAAGAASGLVATVAGGFGLGALLSRELVSSLRSFAASVRQGDFFVGYRVIPEYLWSSERGILLIWLAALGYAVAFALRTSKASSLRWWLLGMALVAGGLVLLSDVIPRFVVYGRLTRQIVPFACLGAGMGIADFMATRRRSQRPLRVVLCVGIGCLAAWNFAAPLRLVFPDEFLRMAKREIFRQASSSYGFYQILYAESLWGKPIGRNLPANVVLLRRPNPMQFRPYQFEGYSVEQRRQMNGSDISMRVIRFPCEFSKADSLWDGYPGPISITVSFRPEFWEGSEPIVVSGKPGAGDVILVRYTDASHIQFGLDHWGAPEILSEPIRTDLSRSHKLAISAGNLVPPQGSPFYGNHPELAGLWDRLVVVLDGQVVLSRRAAFHPATPSTVYFGAAIIGGSATGPNFTGIVSEFGSAQIGQFAGSTPSIARASVLRSRSADWRGSIGPLRLKFRMPALAPGPAAGQPLLSLGGPSSSAVLYAVREGQNMVRIGFDRRYKPLLLSEPLPLSAEGVEVMDICLGSLLPAPDAPIFAQTPGLERMRDRLYVHINGAPALHLDEPFQAVGAEGIALWSNAVGSSVCAGSFQGDVMSTEAIGPGDLLLLGRRLSDLLVNPDDRWGGFTGPIRLRLRFPTGRAGHTEPILVSGAGGSSDIISVRYESDSSARFIFEHSNGQRSGSLPIQISPGAIHDLLLSIGSLMPPDGSPIYADAPEFSQFRSIADVVVDGHPAVFLLCEPHPSARDAVVVGRNTLGSDSTDPEFSGAIEAIMRAPPTDLLEAAAVGGSMARPGWSGYPGPLQMKIVFPEGEDGRGEPILTTGFPGGGDFVFIQFGANGTARLVEDHWGDQLLRSDPFPLVRGSEHRLTVSFGALFPPEGDALYRREPGLAAQRNTIAVELDGRRIIMAARSSHPTPPERIIVGANYIGGSYAGSIFTGRITDLAPAEIGPAAP